MPWGQLPFHSLLGMLSFIHSLNIHLLLTLCQAPSQVLKVGEEGQSPHASCSWGFTI